MRAKHKQQAAAMWRYRRKLELGAKIYAALNAGQSLSFAAASGLFGISRGRLVRIYDWYVRERQIIEMRRQDREAKKAAQQEIANK